MKIVAWKMFGSTMRIERFSARFRRAMYLERRIDWTREYITQRLRRLQEHGLVENLEDTGLYELRNVSE
jgi:DNA-binding HxlR family transcriptional regulator